MDTKAFNEKNFGKSRAVCEGIEREDGDGRVVLTDREREILDMWPRFEDTGEPVWFGDVTDRIVGKVIAIQFGAALVSFWNDSDDRVYMDYGERLKRPAPKVLDADGVEIKFGDTVWHHSGFAHGVVTSIDVGSLMGTVRYVNGGVEFRDAAKDLTHTRPDSWKRLEEDAEFNDETGIVGGNLDIVRRAKTLAGVRE